MLTWLSVWSEVQTCIWPSGCHCVSCFSKIKIGLPFWYRLTQVVPDRGPLNAHARACLCVCVRACMRACVRLLDRFDRMRCISVHLCVHMDACACSDRLAVEIVFLVFISTTMLSLWCVNVLCTEKVQVQVTLLRTLAFSAQSKCGVLLTEAATKFSASKLANAGCPVYYNHLTASFPRQPG